MVDTDTVQDEGVGRTRHPILLPGDGLWLGGDSLARRGWKSALIKTFQVALMGWPGSVDGTNHSNGLNRFVDEDRGWSADDRASS